MDKQNAKDRLLEAGINLFAEKGYAGTSVREITARAGVTEPVLYYYFKNKEGLFRSIMDTASELQKTLLKEILETQGTTLGRLIYLYGRFYEEVLKNKDFFKMINNLVFGPPQGTPDYDIEQYHRDMVYVDKIEIYVNVPELDVKFIKVMQKATVRIDAFPKRRLTGIIDFVAYKADPATKTFLVKVLVNNPGHAIRPGMITRTAFLRRVIPDALVAPLYALVDKDCPGHSLFHVSHLFTSDRP